jgi:hypothetical protein
MVPVWDEYKLLIDHLVLEREYDIKIDSKWSFRRPFMNTASKIKKTRKIRLMVRALGGLLAEMAFALARVVEVFSPSSPRANVTE